MLKRLMIVLVVVGGIVFVPYFICVWIIGNGELIIGDNKDTITYWLNGVEIIFAAALVITILYGIFLSIKYIING